MQSGELKPGDVIEYERGLLYLEWTEKDSQRVTFGSDPSDKKPPAM